MIEGYWFSFLCTIILASQLHHSILLNINTSGNSSVEERSNSIGKVKCSIHFCRSFQIKNMNRCEKPATIIEIQVPTVIEDLLVMELLS